MPKDLPIIGTVVVDTLLQHVPAMAMHGLSMLGEHEQAISVGRADRSYACTMRFETTTRVLAKRMSLHYKIHG